MLPIILFILKLIGILLLVVLGLFLLVLLSVLLVPLRYRGQGSWYGKPAGEFRCSWFLHLVSLLVRYEGEPEIVLRLFGFRLFKEKGRRAEEEFEEAAEGILKEGEAILTQEAGETPAGQALLRDEEEARESRRPLRDPKEEPAEEPNEQAERARPEEYDGDLALSSQEIGGDGGAAEGPEGASDRPTGRFARLKARLLALPGRLRTIFGQLRQKYQQASDAWQAGSEFLADEENRKTLKLMKRQAVKVLRHLRPTRLEGRIRFGLEDPYLMGQILSAAALLYPLYGASFTVTPDFEEKIVEGELKIRGRIRLGTLLAAALRILINPNFRRQLKKFLNRGGSEHGR